MSDTSTVQTLSGEWLLAVDPENVGREELWFESARTAAQPAPVPGIIQQAFPDQNGVVWYYHKFRSLRNPNANERALLRFGMVDYLAYVWLNGQYIGTHEGGEGTFTLDATAFLNPDGENLLAARLLNPTDVPIDGITLVQTPHRNKKLTDHVPGSMFNHGGILRPVELLIVPAVRISDVFARPAVGDGRLEACTTTNGRPDTPVGQFECGNPREGRPDTPVGRPACGQVDVTVTIQNDTSAPVDVNVAAVITPHTTGQVLDDACVTVIAAPGSSVAQIKLIVPQPRPWGLDDPYLYTVAVELSAESGKFEHRASVRCGFRDFRVVDGYFYLNGQRIFLKSTHTGNHFPIGLMVPHNPDFYWRDLLYAKTCGFNMVRFIAGVPFPEQLDYCDEIGLMVYEESYAGWCLEDSPEMAQRYDQSIREMVQRDRNHPSVTVWGLLNETPEGPVFRQAHDALPWLREIDDTRLAILGSGRWDCQHGIGSVSNPGGSKWEHQWGAEAAGAEPGSNAWDTTHGGYFDRAGDAHVYPGVPLPELSRNFLRTLGHNTKPVFLSEFGTGSMFNVVDELRKYDEVGARPDLLDAKLIRLMRDKLDVDWHRFGMEGTYPFPEDLLRDSYHLHIRQRRLNFDLVRSNPNLVGYNITGMLDHGITGEGLWTFWREWKPGIADALRDGWTPLRWCLFPDPLHGYLGRPVRLEAVIANEDVLAPGSYPVTFRVFGPEGVVWERKTEVQIPDAKPGPFAVPVLDEEITLDGPAGEYTFAASLEAGGAPMGDRAKFRITDATQLPRVGGEVLLWGVYDRVRDWLTEHGVNCREFCGESVKAPVVILVGEPENPTSASWRELLIAAAKGCRIVFLAPQAFKKDEDSVCWLPLENKGKCYDFGDWLYHKESVAKAHPVFAGLQNRGIMDWDYYDQIIPRYVFVDQDTPEEVAAAGFAAGHPVIGGYVGALLVAAYPFGAGRVILNTLRILDNVDKHPAADRLLINLITWAREGLADAPSELTTETLARIQSLYP